MPLSQTQTQQQQARRAAACASQHWGPWSIRRDWMDQAIASHAAGDLQIVSDNLAEALQGEDINARDAIDPSDRFRTNYRVTNGIAMIDVYDQLTKYGSSYGGSSYIGIKHALRHARLHDYTAKSALLVLATPGGSTMGIGELEEELQLCRADGFAVDAYCDDQCCSAGYRIACYCGKIFSNRTAQVGCIGTYTVLTDRSAMDKEYGVERVLISSGGVKGMGADGKVTDELRSDVQREINEINDLFGEALAVRGFTPERIIELTDGRAHIASSALDLGLVDEVLTLDQTVAQILERNTTVDETQFRAFAAGNPSILANVAEPLVQAARTEEQATAATNQQTAVNEAVNAERARVTEMSAAFAGHPEFLATQISEGNTVVEAKAAAHDAKLAAKPNDDDKGGSGTPAAGQSSNGVDPVDRPDEDDEGTDQSENGQSAAAGGTPKMSKERERELLAMTPLGEAVLDDEK